MLTDEKIMSFVDKVLIPSFRYDDYVKGLSTRKLVKLAERVIWPNLCMYSLTESLYREMIKRLTDRANNEEMISKILREDKSNEPFRNED